MDIQNREKLQNSKLLHKYAGMDFNRKADPNLFDTIRRAFRDVAAQAHHVSIRYDKIASYANSLKPLPGSQVYDTAHHFIGTDEQTAAFVLILDSVNFGGTWKKDLARAGLALQDDSLYFTTAKRLKGVFETQGGISAVRLSSLDTEACLALFGLPDHPVASTLAAHYALSLRELGDYIKTRHQGRFLGVVEAADGSVEKLVRQLAGLKSFNDVHDYKGIRVPLLKRAQITAADLHLAFAHRGRKLFHDINELTTFPDNAVAHVLHEDGILEYSGALEQKIQSDTPLWPSSEEEIEIRACTGLAVEMIREWRPEFTSMDIDHILWHRSHEPDYLVHNHHKVLTIFY